MEKIIVLNTTLVVLVSPFLGGYGFARSEGGDSSGGGRGAGEGEPGQAERGNGRDAGGGAAQVGEARRRSRQSQGQALHRREKRPGKDGEDQGGGETTTTTTTMMMTTTIERKDVWASVRMGENGCFTVRAMEC